MANNDVLISIEPRFYDSIVSGEKTVELRRRAPRIAPGSRIWLYCKSPVATISAVCELRDSETLPVSDLWRRHGKQLAITKSEFDVYLQNRREATALLLNEVQTLENPVGLAQARSMRLNFQPPQFFMRLHNGCKLTTHLEHAIS